MRRVSPDEVRRARQADLVEWLRGQGYQLRPEGSGNYRVVDLGGIIVHGNHYADFRGQGGGNALDCLTRELGMPFLQAVRALAGVSPAGAGSLPVLNGCRAPTCSRAVSYLTGERQVPEELVREVLEGNLLYEDPRGNCVFPCVDPHGQVRGAIIRGTGGHWAGRAPGSDAAYGWWWPADDPDASGVVVVESPIDALSIEALRPGTRANHHILALGGLQAMAVMQFLVGEKHVRRVILALDNDPPGRAAAIRFRELIAGRNDSYEVSAIWPTGETWNKDLTSRIC